ncbi:MAG: CHASE2 domain-containing protein [Candidatus Sericytochromatia bacterium]|nr:CHASE2 domain-containing protein [Candidatus Sericytochromatia bacterium]
MRAVFLAFAICAGWTALTLLGALEPLERLSVRARYMLTPLGRDTDDVVVVAIDERSLARYGQMPWDRRLFAQLVDHIGRARPSVIGIDVAFNEPARQPAEDRSLAQALSRVPTVLPIFLAYADAARLEMRAVEPLPVFGAAAVALGSVQLASHVQTEVWELEPFQNVVGHWVPAFPTAVLGAHRGSAVSPPSPHFPWRTGPQLFHFQGPRRHPLVSAVDVLEGQVSPSALTGRMVLLGATATGLPDTNFAVADPRMGPLSGVELAACAIDNLARDGFLQRLAPLAIALLMLALALGPGRVLTRGSDGPARRTLWLLLAAAAWSVLSLIAFRDGVWLEVVPVLGALASCHLAGVWGERADLLEHRNQLLARYGSDLAAEAQRQRARIEGELHDGIQQQLVVIGREVRRLLKRSETTDLTDRLQFLAAQTEEAQGEIKRLRGDLLPPALRHGGLAEALPVLALQHAQRSGLDVRAELASWEPLPEAREVELYWLVNEALTNALKHAAASRVRIRLDQSPQTAIIEVSDDGQGFTPPDLSIPPPGIEHSGLHRMWLRMRSHHGDLAVHSRPGAGTTLRFTLPVERREG